MYKTVHGEDNLLEQLREVNAIQKQNIQVFIQRKKIL